jgi:predicted TIM-barrel fold metal-dependent hydrolase
MRQRVDPEGLRLPIKLDTASNGEFVPVPLSPVNREANRLAREVAIHNARRVNRTRRDFMISACGAATTLLAFNAANAAAGRTGGFFDVPGDAALDLQLAQATVGRKGEFVFDVQGHFVDPNETWLKTAPADAFKWSPKAACALGSKGGARAHLACLGPEEFVKDVFLDSDTDMMVLSFGPATREAEPLTIEAADAVRRIVDRLQGTRRLLIHGRVNPNQPGDVEAMDELKARWGVAAWKTYTQWGPDGRGFFMHDEPGIRFIEKARSLGIKNICIHKGLPFGKRSYEHSQCSDIGIVAKRYPDVNFLIYHSGFVTGVTERAYDYDARRDGIDTLIRSLVDNDVKPGSNVYAELGSTWRFLMRDPEQAAHALGKLIRYCGEDNVLWGTDSIWYGSPQDQIQAFRTFQIAPRLREQHGYPEITPALRAKVFGLNGAKVYNLSAAEVKQHTGHDAIARERTAYQERPDPHFRTYGPKTRREFLNLLAWGRH